MKQDPDAELRKIWTDKGVSEARQNEMIAEIEAKARPGAMVGPFRVAEAIGRITAALDNTPAGPQTVLPGAEKASDATMAQRRADAPLKPKKAQRPCDAGLFSDEKNQISLF